MVLTITQETFDEAVQENINDLGLSPEEALEEAVNQYLSQGADLSQIITDPAARSNLETINNLVKRLRDVHNQSDKNKEIVELLTELKQELDKGVQHRVLATRAGAYDVILELIKQSGGDNVMKILALKTMIALTVKNPDVLTDAGVGQILAHLEDHLDPEIQKLALRWAKESCIMHEMNRQKLFNANILDKLTRLKKQHNTEVLKAVLAVIRGLILDDDIRVEFGRAHEHARVIASETIAPITQLISKFKTEEELVHDLMLTLSALLVRAEFCKAVQEAGALDLIHEVMSTFGENERISKQCFKLLKALSGNDECKGLIIQKGLAPVISNSFNNHTGVVPTAVAGLHCVAALSLRSPDNSKALFEADVPKVIVETMRRHPNEKNVQKTASWAIRNMVSRSRYQNQHFLDLGAEEILKNSLAIFKDFEYDIKAALRDLECDVELKEEWTGKGGKLNTENDCESP